jgi:hypothetical protein
VAEQRLENEECQASSIMSFYSMTSIDKNICYLYVANYSYIYEYMHLQANQPSYQTFCNISNSTIKPQFGIGQQSIYIKVIGKRDHVHLYGAV